MTANEISRLKQTEFNGVKALADGAEVILKAKDVTRNLPTERTVRYYLHEELLPPPQSKIGQTSVFNYHHLLIVLLVSQLKEQGLPHRTIKDVIRLKGKTIEELEKLWVEGVHVFTSQRDLDDYRRSIGHTDDQDVVVINDDTATRDYLENQCQAPEKNEAKEFLESLLLGSESKRSDDGDSHFALYMRSAPRDSSPPSAPPPENWKRYKVAPGIELHVSRDFKPPKDERELQTVLGFIERILRGRSRTK